MYGISSHPVLSTHGCCPFRTEDEITYQQSPKHSKQGQHKALVLLVAQQARKAVERSPPHPTVVVLLVQTTNLQINAVPSALQLAPVDNGNHSFEIAAFCMYGGQKRVILLVLLDMARSAYLKLNDLMDKSIWMTEQLK